MKTTTFLFSMAVLLVTASCGEQGPEDDPLQNTPPAQPPTAPPITPSPGTTAPGASPPVTTPSGHVPPATTPRTPVPDELVGAWQHGWVDFEFWENYTEGYWAGRNAAPSREAMVFKKNGEAKFYRYEFLFNFYEELIDCEGTVAFHGDGTFTFHPTKGRKRFHDFRNNFRSADRPLTAAELTQPKLAGKRAYSYDPSSTPPAIQIKVPSSAPYNWYKKE